jgi:hypothetical protein
VTNNNFKNLYDQIVKNRVLVEDWLKKYNTPDIYFYHTGQLSILKMVIEAINCLGQSCDDCESLNLNLQVCNKERANLSSENFSLETENQINRVTIRTLRHALLLLYNDVKSEHGLDEHEIEADSSSLGLTKSALAKSRQIYGPLI